MILFSTRKRSFSLLLIVLVCSFICGCNSYTRYYLYEGNPRSSDEVAVFVCQKYTIPTALNGTAMGKRLETFDVPPGEYHLRFVYFKNVANNWGAGDPISIRLIARPGYVYYFYPHFLKNSKWQVTIAEFADSEAIFNFDNSIWDDLDNGKSIKNRVDLHFQTKNTQAHLLSNNQKAN